MILLELALLVSGVFFLSVSTVGLLRLPDFYSRAHAAGKSETLGAILILGAVALHHGAGNTSLKILLIVLLIAVNNPTGVHALTRAAVRSGREIWNRKRREATP